VVWNKRGICLPKQLNKMKENGLYWTRWRAENSVLFAFVTQQKGVHGSLVLQFTFQLPLSDSFYPFQSEACWLTPCIHLSTPVLVHSFGSLMNLLLPCTFIHSFSAS
jgi:hypothetical protein